MSCSMKNNPLSKSLCDQFERFLEYHPPKRLIKNLRRMLLEFLLETNVCEAADYYKNLIYDLEGLFELLDVAEAEWKE